MSILTDSAILAARRRGEILISPFKRAALGGCSYDVHLSPWLLTYAADRPLDCKQAPHVLRTIIPPAGLTLIPERLYLASTIEYTETHKHVPVLDGKSSLGRFGMWAHITAGFGDIGFKGHWTLEIVVVHPLKVYAGMPIGQLRYHTVEGDLLQPYDTKPNAKYTDARDPWPQASRMARNFPVPYPRPGRARP